MNIKLIDNQIARCEGQIISLLQSLPYADGGAYSQDKQRISELQTELGQWKDLRASASALQAKEQGSPLLDGLTFHAQGEANSYRLMKDGNWFAVVQMNGEMLVSQQEALLAAMLANAGAQGGAQ